MAAILTGLPEASCPDIKKTPIYPVASLSCLKQSPTKLK